MRLRVTQEHRHNVSIYVRNDMLVVERSIIITKHHQIRVDNSRWYADSSFLVETDIRIDSFLHVVPPVG